MIRTNKVKAKQKTKSDPNKYKTERLLSLLEEYTESNDIPILKEFCYINRLSYQYLVNLRNKQADAGDNRLSLSISQLMMKKESQIERKGYRNEINTSMAVFSLKQLGWKDKQELELGINKINNLKITLVKAE
ncbi:hypothetical protein [Clostridium sp.]|uniref:hypothetical protein n=1 Tax=Clostridium sp. TaxID=1506 RepID=UPI001A56156C|nr:hypothetical protein [Clostridium sp.]MBK5234029.1 hypothetical protein [Clostridium sp.]